MFVCSLLMSSIDNQTIIFGLDVDFIWFEVLNINVDSELGVSVHHLHIKKWDLPLETVFTTCILKMSPTIKNTVLSEHHYFREWSPKYPKIWRKKVFPPHFSPKTKLQLLQKIDWPGLGKKTGEEHFFAFPVFTRPVYTWKQPRVQKTTLNSHLFKS